jgi:hypothetical protein
MSGRILVGVVLIAVAAVCAEVEGLDSGRVGQIAVRFSAPEPVPAAVRRELDRAVAALVKKEAEAATSHWREFWRKRVAEGGRFDPDLYVDYALNRLGAARDPALAAAGRKLGFYDRQEAAATEHVASLDKHISVYGETDTREVPLREPELAEYGEGVEPVTMPAGKSVRVPELAEHLRVWREKLPAITHAREVALADYELALRANVALIEEWKGVEARLREEIPLDLR